jgi:hypothetical protein
MKMNRKGMMKAKTGIVAGVAAMSLLAGGAVAYFSGNASTVSNNFKIVAGSQGATNVGTIEEDLWKVEAEKDTNEDGIKDVKQLMPGQTVTKDPSLKSGVNYPAYAYIRVKVPTISAKTSKDAQAQTYDAVTPAWDTENWTLVESKVSTTAGEDSVYIYRCNDPLAAAGTTTVNAADSSKKADQTTELFKSFTVGSFTSVDNALEDAIEVSGALVQVDGFYVGASGEGSSADAEAKSIFTAMD